MHLTDYAWVGHATWKGFLDLFPHQAHLHWYFQCSSRHVPEVLAAQIAERILRGYFLYGDSAFFVRMGVFIHVEQVPARQHAFLNPAPCGFPPEPQTWALQPETEGIAQMVGANSGIGDWSPPEDGCCRRVERFVLSYADVSARTRRLVELLVRAKRLHAIQLHEEAFLNLYKIYESFVARLRQRFPVEAARLKGTATGEAEPEVVARLVGYNVQEDHRPYARALRDYRNQVVAHWNWEESNSNWQLPMKSLAFLYCLAYKIVRWEIGSEARP